MREAVENLFEELATDDERASENGHPKIFVGHVKGSNLDALVTGMEALLGAADGTDEHAVYEGLRRLIPEFTGTQTDDGARTDDGGPGRRRSAGRRRSGKTDGGARVDGTAR